MFEILKNDVNLSFTVKKQNTAFGDDDKILFWIDLELRALQRGRQEYIPIDSLDYFAFSAEGGKLEAIMGKNRMVLYQNPAEDPEAMRNAVNELNAYCGMEQE